MSSSPIPTDTRSVTYGHISTFVYVHGYPLNTAGSRRSRRLAASFIHDGYRVTDHHGFDLTIQWAIDGSGGRVVRGEDPLGAYNDRGRLRTLERARLAGTETGRPAGLPARKLTDYEAGVKHDIEMCTTPNCDHPVHFGGDEYGKLTFADKDAKSDVLRDKKNDEGGAGGAGAMAGAGAVEKA